MATIKLSAIASGGAMVPSTDTLVAVRSGTTDVLVSAFTPGNLTPTATATYGSTTTLNSDTASAYKLTATGNTTLAITGTPVEGQTLRIGIFASGGSWTVALPGGTFNIPTSSSATSPVTVTTGTETVFAFEYSSRTGLWRVVSLVPGYS